MDADVHVQPDTIQRLRDGDGRRSARSRSAARSSCTRALPTRFSTPAAACTSSAKRSTRGWTGRSPTRGTARAGHRRRRRPAACCSIAQAAIDVGLFDERYFMGKDDGDFTHRMRIAGYRILELPDALVLHDSRPRSDWLFYYQIRNRWHFMLKNYQWRTLICDPAVPRGSRAAAAAGAACEGARRDLLEGGRRPDRDAPGAAARSRRGEARSASVPDGALLRRRSADRPRRSDDADRAARQRTWYEAWLAAYWSLLRRTVLPDDALRPASSG